jgi:hypothetical protein
MTNKGLQIQFKFYEDSVLLDCVRALSDEPLAIFLRPIPDFDSTGTKHFRNNQYARIALWKPYKADPKRIEMYRERTIFFKEHDADALAIESSYVRFDLMSERRDYYPFNILQVFPPQRWESTKPILYTRKTPYRVGLLFANVDCGCWVLIAGYDGHPGHLWCRLQQASLSANLERLILDSSHHDAGMSPALEFAGSVSDLRKKIAVTMHSRNEIVPLFSPKGWIIEIRLRVEGFRKREISEAISRL